MTPAEREMAQQRLIRLYLAAHQPSEMANAARGATPGRVVMLRLQIAGAEAPRTTDAASREAAG